MNLAKIKCLDDAAGNFDTALSYTGMLYPLLMLLKYGAVIGLLSCVYRKLYRHLCTISVLLSGDSCTLPLAVGGPDILKAITLPLGYRGSLLSVLVSLIQCFSAFIQC